MLNGYHIQFLRNLDDYHVRFLVIGGQARWLHWNTPTRDLDVWVDISDANRPALEKSLIAWKKRYPIHTQETMEPPLPIRPKVLIQFPDRDNVYYFQTDEGGIGEIKYEDRVDVLFSADVKGLEFEECFQRSVLHQVDGIDIRCLAETDLEEPESNRRDDSPPR